MKLSPGDLGIPVLVLEEAGILTWLYVSWQRVRFSPGYTCTGRGWDSHLGILVLAEAEILEI
jgi:hypothetical protein